MNTGFDRTAHKVDVRRIADQRGRYNIQNIGIFLWSLNAYSVTLSPCAPVPGQPHCFRFSTLGRDLPLFNNPIAQGADITAPATARECSRMSAAATSCAMKFATTSSRTPRPSTTARRTASPSISEPSKRPPYSSRRSCRVCDLSGPDGSWNNMPQSGGLIAIDPHIGRIALPPGTSESTPLRPLTTTASTRNMGGGEYSRESSFTASPQQVIVRVPGDQPTISAAVATLPGDGVVEVSNSGTYTEPAGLTIPVAANGHIELRAADGARPTLFLGGGHFCHRRRARPPSTSTDSSSPTLPPREASHPSSVAGSNGQR